MAVCLAALAVTAAASSRQRACGRDAEVVDGLCTELYTESTAAADSAALGLLQQRAAEHATKDRQLQFPDFDDIVKKTKRVAKKVASKAVGQATDALTSAVDQAKDVVVGAVDQATATAKEIKHDVTAQAKAIVREVKEEAVEVANGATTEAGVLAAQSLNATLELVGVQANALLKQCMRLRNSTVAFVRESEPTVSARLEALDKATGAAIDGILPVWGNISEAVRSMGAIAGTALNAVGAKHIGKEFAAVLEQSITKADDCVESLRRVPKSLANFKNTSEDQLASMLHEANQTMEAALVSVENYASILMDAFDGLTNKVPEAIEGALPGVNETELKGAFDEVDATAEDILGRIVEGPRELLSGMGEAVWLTQSVLPENGASARASSATAAIFALAAAALAAVPAWA